MLTLCYDTKMSNIIMLFRHRQIAQQNPLLIWMIENVTKDLRVIFTYLFSFDESAIFTLTDTKNTLH